MKLGSLQITNGLGLTLRECSRGRDLMDTLGQDVESTLRGRETLLRTGQERHRTLGKDDGRKEFSNARHDWVKNLG